MKQLAVLANNVKLSSLEKKSLESIIKQYESYKTSWETALQEAEDAAIELENLDV